jgi:hypothetical protein
MFETAANASVSISGEGRIFATEGNVTYKFLTGGTGYVEGLTVRNGTLTFDAAATTLLIGVTRDGYVSGGGGGVVECAASIVLNHASQSLKLTNAWNFYLPQVIDADSSTASLYPGLLPAGASDGTDSSLNTWIDGTWTVAGWAKVDTNWGDCRRKNTYR